LKISLLDASEFGKKIENSEKKSSLSDHKAMCEGLFSALSTRKSKL